MEASSLSKLFLNGILNIVLMDCGILIDEVDLSLNFGNREIRDSSPEGYDLFEGLFDQIDQNLVRELQVILDNDWGVVDYFMANTLFLLHS